MTQQLQTTKQTATKTVEPAAPVESELDRLLHGPVSYVPFGASAPITFDDDIVLRTLCTPTKAGHWPSEQELYKFKQLCKARGLNPFEGDAFLVGYDSVAKGPQFSIITSIYAFLKRAQAAKDFDGMESGVIVQDAAGNLVDRVGDFCMRDDKLAGGWAIVHQKGISHPWTKRLRLDARDKGTPLWQSDAAGMICKCAEVDALRSAYPSATAGMYISGEIGDEQPTKTPRMAPPTRPPEKSVRDMAGEFRAAAVARGANSVAARALEAGIGPIDQDTLDLLASGYYDASLGLANQVDAALEAAPTKIETPVVSPIETSAATDVVEKRELMTGDCPTLGRLYSLMAEFARDAGLGEPQFIASWKMLALAKGWKGMKADVPTTPDMLAVANAAQAGSFDWASGKVL